MKYASNVIDVIGNTPLVQLRTVTKGIRATILVKIEYLNPGGSIKDRMALQIISDAEKKGLLKKGSTIIECTGSGNTGIGLAMIAAVRGYKTIFTMPDKNSQEKINMLKAYGAEVIICPTNVAPNDPRSYYQVAERLAHEIPHAFFARQYSNPSNPKSHYLSTGPEIWKQTDGEIDYFIAGMGTGGTISGTGKYLKDKKKSIKVIGVDPAGSVYIDYFKRKEVTNKAKTYLIEGIGEDFIPGTINFSIIDDVVQVTDKEAYQMGRRLAREEGILVGSSSGAAVAGAIKFAKQKKLSRDKIVVVLLPDSGRSYLSKLFNDEWMAEHGLLQKKRKDASVHI
ncbi:MAG TPA: cysteine synthase A [Candidatus Acidoferrales bacterium]|nr:cysteine synthase A [Candidatus Acidoferrales bacterium]